MKTLTECIRQTSRKIRGVESDYADIAFLGMRSKVRNYSYSPNHTAINTYHNVFNTVIIILTKHGVARLTGQPNVAFVIRKCTIPRNIKYSNNVINCNTYIFLKQ